MIGKIGTFFRPLVKNKQEEDPINKGKKEKKSRGKLHQKDGEEDDFNQLLGENQNKITSYLEQVNNHEYYKSRNLEFKITSLSLDDRPQIVIENNIEKRIIQKISVDQFIKIHHQVTSNSSNPQTGYLINIKC